MYFCCFYQGLLFPRNGPGGAQLHDSIARVTPPKSHTPNDLFEFLKTHGLEQHCDGLVQLGVRRVHDLHDVDRECLDILQMKKLEEKRFIRALEQHRQNEQPLLQLTPQHPQQEAPQYRARAPSLFIPPSQTVPVTQAKQRWDTLAQAVRSDRSNSIHIPSSQIVHIGEPAPVSRLQPTTPEPNTTIAAGGDTMRLVQGTNMHTIAQGFERGQLELMGDQPRAVVCQELADRAFESFATFKMEHPDFEVTAGTAVEISGAFLAARGAKIDWTQGGVHAGKAHELLRQRRDYLVAQGSTGELQAAIPDEVVAQEVASVIIFCELFEQLVDPDALVFFGLQQQEAVGLEQPGRELEAEEGLTVDEIDEVEARMRQKMAERYISSLAYYCAPPIKNPGFYVKLTLNTCLGRPRTSQIPRSPPWLRTILHIFFTTLAFPCLNVKDFGFSFLHKLHHLNTFSLHSRFALTLGVLHQLKILSQPGFPPNFESLIPAWLCSLGRWI
jgi:hypothetical protein